MNVVGYGGGTDSTAMLIGLWRHHVPVDLILFADPGAEQPHTYAYLDTMSRWLENHGMPAITRVWYTEKNGQRLTLEQECLRSGTLPSIAYGYKKCSLKHKVAPQEKFCTTSPALMPGRKEKRSSSSLDTMPERSAVCSTPFLMTFRIKNTRRNIP